MLCTTTARGDLLAGTTPQVQTTARGTNTAITLTLDANIQRACEAIAAQNMSKGCIIVMQVGSGQIWPAPVCRNLTPMISPPASAPMIPPH